MRVWDLIVVIFSAGFFQTLLTGLLLFFLQVRYNRQLETLRLEIRMRERATTIAELFAEWDSKPEDLKRLNQLVCEVSLWLPAPIVRDLTKALCYEEDRKQPKEILIDVRNYLRGKADDLTAIELVHFDAPEQPRLSQP